MEILEQLTKYVLFTSHIENEKPVSLLIVANAESGKTVCIDKYNENEGIVYFNDITPWGLTKEIHKLHQLGKPINHILIPDFLNIIAKNQVSQKGMIQFLKSGIEEGITKIKTYGIEFDIGKTLNFGLITAITKDAFMSRRRNWSSIGFLSRMVPFSYKYKLTDVQNILESIYEQQYHTNSKIKLILPTTKVDIILPIEIAKKLRVYTQRLAYAEKIYGFRHQKQFQTLLKAVALSKDKNKVDEDDFNDLEQCLEYCNLEFNQI